MDPAHALQQVPWDKVGLSMVKACTIYIFILVGLKMVGRRVFRGMGPQEIFLITLLAKVAGDNLVSKEAGIWANLAGGISLFLLVTLMDRVTPLRRWIEGNPETVYENGRVYSEILERHSMCERDLERVARDYGRPSYRDFERITLERDGRMTGVLKREARTPENAVSQQRQITRIP